MPEVLWIFIRSIISFILLLALTRWIGPTQLSQLTFFDYIVGITIGSIAASLAVDQNIKMLNGVVGVTTWASLTVLFALLGLKSYWFRRIEDGEPMVVIKDGQVQEKTLRKLRMTVDQLMLLLREKNAFHLSDVEFAVMETNGKISVMKKKEAQPATPKDLGIPVAKADEPRIVILDGHIMEKTLKSLGFDKNWLMSELRKQGINDAEEVFIAQLDNSGSLYIDRYMDKAQPRPRASAQKPLLAASLRKIKTDLQSIARETKNKEDKKIFEEQAARLQKLIDDLSPYLHWKGRKPES